MCTQITLTRSYNEAEFREDLKILYKMLGEKHVVFLFTDAHVLEEGFLELINNMLTTGMVRARAHHVACDPLYTQPTLQNVFFPILPPNPVAPAPPPLRRALLIVVPAPQLLAAWCVYVVPVFSIPSPVQVPALYEPDEKDALANSQRAAVKAAGQFDTKENCWTFFVNRCRNHLHLVLAMSPSGETLRRRCRNFPVRSVAGRPAAVHRHCPSAGLRGEGVVCRVCVGGGLR